MNNVISNFLLNVDQSGPIPHINTTSCTTGMR